MAKTIKMTEKENQDWKNLCDYVKYEILEYDKSLKFPQQLVLRLKGLNRGQFMANKGAEIQAEYSFEIILLTFKVCKCKIKNYLHDNSAKIKDEEHKINVIMLFVEKEINDVYLRMKAKEQIESKIDNLELDNQCHNGAEYKKNPATKQNERLKNLW